MAKKKEPIYKIEYYYQTGDSFSSSDIHDVLEYEWKTLGAAQDALRRIKEHYEWYQSKEYPRIEKEKRPPKWWTITCSDDMKHYYINLKMDNGKEVQFWCPWCGYFEKLHSVKIIIDGLDENKYVFS